MIPIRPYFELCRPRVSLFSALSAATGFFLAAPPENGQAAGLAAGVFLLACGASALNQYQERDRDRLMPRTRARPLPSGMLQRPLKALLFSLAGISAGLCVVLLTGGVKPAILGLLTVVWYNGVYTLLKEKTPFAIIPGALVGSMPPVIGWAAAGGGLLNSHLPYIVFFFFMWQVPHFWLLLLRYGREYEKAGLPCLSSILTEAQLTRIVFSWINASAASAILIAGAGMLKSPAAKSVLVAASLWLVWNGSRLLRQREEAGYAIAFHRINVYMLLAMAAMTADRFMDGFPLL